MNIKNPFPTTSYIGPEYFCDRKNETKSLITNIRNNQSTTLVAMRRMGKTALIYHTFQALPKKFTCIYVDILPTQNEQEFLNALLTAIAISVPRDTSPGKKIWNFIKGLRPVISFDPVTGNPQLSLNNVHRESSQSIQDVFTFLENLNQPVVIAIDEFQRVTSYPEKNTDAWLRSVIQMLKNIRFIFAGSQRHLMLELFSDPSRPFYRSTAILHFDRIATKEYKEFILHHFHEKKKTISEQLISDILNWSHLHTYYVQLICNRIFAASGKNVTEKIVEQEKMKLLKEQEIVFYQYRELLTRSQWNLLIAIGLEGKVTAPTSAAFIGKYNLGNPATVLQSINSLVQKEMVYYQMPVTASKVYFVYDLLLRRWIEHKFAVNV